jgi:hypothetical protein
LIQTIGNPAAAAAPAAALRRRNDLLPIFILASQEKDKKNRILSPFATEYGLRCQSLLLRGTIAAKARTLRVGSSVLSGFLDQTLRWAGLSATAKAGTSVPEPIGWLS